MIAVRSSRHPMVAALLTGTLQKVREWDDLSDPQDPLYKYTHLIRQSRDAQEDPVKFKLSEESIRNALELPPVDPELFFILLRIAVVWALHSNNSDELRRIQRLLPSLKKSLREKDIQRWCLRLQFLIHFNLDEDSEAFESSNEILSLSEKGDKEWIRAKGSNFWTLIKMEEFELAREQLADLEPYRSKCEHGLSYEIMDAYWHYCCGKAAEGLKLLPPFKKSDPCVFLKTRVLLLIKNGDLAAARQILESVRDRVSDPSIKTLGFDDVLSRSLHECLLAREALARKDFDAVRQHGKNGMAQAETTHVFLLRDIQQLVAMGELAIGDARQARVILQLMDPEESKTVYSMEWARLYLLEGNEDRAVSHAQKVLQKGSLDLFYEKLRYAYELSPADAIRLFERASRISPRKASTSLAKMAVIEKTTDELIGKSPGIRQVKEKISQFAELNYSILIDGETGCGKEVVAGLLHKNGSHSNEPFMSINCGAMSDTLIESELFGHVKGAFTGAISDYEGLFVAARKGTIFLDEISSMSMRVQTALLRVLEEREVRPVGASRTRKINARVVAATNESLEEMVKEKKFRKDLYYRLEQLHIHIPPLRERPEDIPLLVNHFLSRLYGDFPVSPGEDLLDLFKHYPWPGNVRQLKHEVERVAVIAGNTQILNAGLSTLSRSANQNGLKIPADDAASSVALGNPRSTLSRRKRLRELFTKENELTRADVIRIMDCNHTTAATDLKVLEQEGWIRRVHTSSSLRTSYFVRNLK